MVMMCTCMMVHHNMNTYIWITQKYGYEENQGEEEEEEVDYEFSSEDMMGEEKNDKGLDGDKGMEGDMGMGGEEKRGDQEGAERKGDQEGGGGTEKHGRETLAVDGDTTRKRSDRDRRDEGKRDRRDGGTRDRSRSPKRARRHEKGDQERHDGRHERDQRHDRVKENERDRRNDRENERDKRNEKDRRKEKDRQRDRHEHRHREHTHHKEKHHKKRHARHDAKSTVTRTHDRPSSSSSSRGGQRHRDHKQRGVDDDALPPPPSNLPTPTQNHPSTANTPTTTTRPIQQYVVEVLQGVAVVVVRKGKGEEGERGDGEGGGVVQGTLYDAVLSACVYKVGKERGERCTLLCVVDASLCTHTLLVSTLTYTYTLTHIHQLTQVQPPPIAHSLQVTLRMLHLYQLLTTLSDTTHQLVRACPKHVTLGPLEHTLEQGAHRPLEHTLEHGDAMALIAAVCGVLDECGTVLTSHGRGGVVVGHDCVSGYAPISTMPSWFPDVHPPAMVKLLTARRFLVMLTTLVHIPTMLAGNALGVDQGKQEVGGGVGGGHVGGGHVGGGHVGGVHTNSAAPVRDTIHHVTHTHTG